MMAPDIAIPGWEFRASGDHYGRTLWQITAPPAPGIAPLAKHLNCDLQQQMDAIWICAAGDDLWLFQQDDSGYWLTHARGTPSAIAGRRYPGWLGQLLYENAGGELALAIFLSSRNETQLLQFLRLRFAHREPSLKEIQHGQFHILLQAPRQDILVLSQGAEYLLVLFGNPL